MLIVADENIPYAHQAFGALGQLRLMPGRDITPATLAGADALMVRSVTRVNRDLLHGSGIRFVGTATVGTDHVDLDYLHRQGIPFADAASCGTRSVAEYVVSALFTLRRRRFLSITGQRIGIVGVGRIGSQVETFASTLGMDVLLYDPPRAARQPEFISASLDELFDCDVITLHVPLTHNGLYPTRRMVGEDFLQNMKPGAVLINTARGDVVDSGALLSALSDGRNLHAVLDVWGGEPDVPKDLLEQCTLATPHIAGYALDARALGTQMVAAALADFMGAEAVWSPDDSLPRTALQIDLRDVGDVPELARRAVCTAYMIAADDAAVRGLFGLDDTDRRAGFDALRRYYPARRLFTAYRVLCPNARSADLLSGLGFDACV